MDFFGCPYPPLRLIECLNRASPVQVTADDIKGAAQAAPFLLGQRVVIPR